MHVFILKERSDIGVEIRNHLALAFFSLNQFSWGKVYCVYVNKGHIKHILNIRLYFSLI